MARKQIIPIGLAPIRVAADRKLKWRRQVAAVPLRTRAGNISEVLLITSRETRRWIIPKGWPKKGTCPRQTAADEALEEAGVVGRISKRPLGCYRTWKRLETLAIPVKIAVFRLDVERQLDTWREKGQRERAWFSLEEAIDIVREPGLVETLRNLQS